MKNPLFELSQPSMKALLTKQHKSIHSRTKFYYLIPNSGVGSYENRFLTPLAPGVWATAAAAAAACGAVLAAAARVERRPQPASYALFSVVAAACQQGMVWVKRFWFLNIMVLELKYSTQIIAAFNNENK